MYISITSILLGLGGKCLLNWALVFLQKNYISRSFLGVFSVSLAVVDTALMFTVTPLHIFNQEYVVLSGLQLTRYHTCLLVQILGYVYRVLQWPVVVMAGLDHFCTVTQRLQTATFRAKWIVYWSVTGLLWCLAVLYVFLLSDIIPVLEDVSHYEMYRCWVFLTSQIPQIALSLFLILGCAALYAGHPLVLSCCLPQLLLNNKSPIHSRRNFVHQALSIFLHTWTLFLVALAPFLLLPMGITSYLDLNVAWLCFLNSLLITIVLCAVCPTSQLSQDLAVVPPDSFCKWRFNFSPVGEAKT